VTCAKSSELITYDAHLLQKSCVLCIGDLPERYFKEAVEKEGAVVCVVSAKLSEPEMNRCLQHAQDKEIMVVACGSLHKNVHAAFGISDNARKLVAECKKQGKKMVVVFFGTPYSAVYFQDTDLVLVAYEDAVPAQEAVVDVLRGRLKAEGNLSVALPKEHNVG
jgi:hypothetical protein